jgi:hypothetical protein
MAITSLTDLQEHVRWAIQLEHSTLAPYLYAYYSFKNAGTEDAPEAARIIKDVVVEEMLHMAHTCNIYNALGGEHLNLTDAYYFPTYPGPLPHHRTDPPLTLHLEKASISLISNVFQVIEKPESIGAIAEGDHYAAIGQFYKAIQIGLEAINEFPGDRAKQVTRIFGYGGGRHGHLVKVTDLYSASLAIKQIVEQGEGSAQTEYSPDGGLAHYWKFNQIVDGTLPFRARDIYPVVGDPKVAELPEGPVRELCQFFNDSYCLLLRALSKIYSQGDSSELVKQGSLFTLMDGVLRPAAQALVQTPIPGTDVNAGPSFEHSTAPQDDVERKAAILAEQFPRLEAIPQALKELPPIDD